MPLSLCFYVLLSCTFCDLALNDICLDLLWAKFWYLSLSAEPANPLIRLQVLRRPWAAPDLWSWCLQSWWSRFSSQSKSTQIAKWVLIQDFVEETKKSSGLDEKVLSNQAGNEQSPTFGTTDVKTGKGQEVAGNPIQFQLRFLLSIDYEVQSVWKIAAPNPPSLCRLL